MTASKGRRLGAAIIDGIILSTVLTLALVLVIGSIAASTVETGSGDTLVLEHAEDAESLMEGFDLLGEVEGGGLIFGSLATFASALLMAIAYKFVLQLTPWRATFGKKILGLRIVAADGQEASGGAIILREIIFAVVSGVQLVNVIFLIMLAVHEEARGWHDLAAGTKVVRV